MKTFLNQFEPFRRSAGRPRPAFTLLELVVVLLVLGILAGLTVPAYRRVQENSVVGVANRTLEVLDRNGEAIGASGTDLSDNAIASAVLAEISLPGDVTVSREGATLTVTHFSGSVTVSGSVTFAGGVGSIDSAEIVVPAASSTTTSTSPPSIVYTVGDVGPGGGVVFYVDLAGFSCGPTRGDTCTYLEAAPAAAEIELVWAAPENQSSEVSGADDVGIGAGHKNSVAVASQPGNVPSTSAALHALAYAANGFDDWFLPSKHELGQLHQRRVLVGGFSPTSYWSSSEYSAYDAWTYHFSAGYYSYDSKASLSGFRVRPIRAG